MKIFFSCFFLFALLSFSPKQKVDLLVYNATIYTVDEIFSTKESMVVNDGKIVETGPYKKLKAKYEAGKTIDAKGKFIYPGFIDAHAHFQGYANGLQNANLVGAESWQATLDILKQFAVTHPTGWLLGRGWDQNDWDVKEFPTNQKLNELFPDRPVFLTRVDGHAAIANDKALELAGIKAGYKLTGGEAEVKNGRLTGILIDNAKSLVNSKIPPPSNEILKKLLGEAQQNCFAMGLTTIDDCGVGFKTVEMVKTMQESGELKMRFYLMLSDNALNYAWAGKNGKLKTPSLNVRSFKVYADGALGSRGASLLEPYSDKPGSLGFLLSSQKHFDSVAKVIYDLGFQMCTHAIGDSGNRTMLNIYGKYLKGKNDLRWRIEHAQVVNKNDFKLFGKYSIVPSVQPTHATSDMYWAGDRLGAERVKGAYAFQQLLKENGWIPLGTDFPVEDISPFKTFYAAVIRKDAKGWPDKGYQMDNALSRKDALKGMTIWAAKSNFEENEKGSLVKGKYADFIILDNDLMKAPSKNLLNIKVVRTFLGGEEVYSR